MTTDPNAKAPTRAEGSPVGACGEHAPNLDGMTSVVLCHLAAGHTGMHSDGVTQWTPGLIYPTAPTVIEAERQRLEAERDAARWLLDTQLAAWRRTREERDEACGQLNALVAEVRKIADDVRDLLADSSPYEVISAADVERVLRRAIATTAPQTAPPEPAQGAEDVSLPSLGRRVGTYRLVPVDAEPRSDDKPAADGGVTEEREGAQPVVEYHHDGERYTYGFPGNDGTLPTAMAEIKRLQGLVEIGTRRHVDLAAERDAAVKARDAMQNRLDHIYGCLGVDGEHASTGEIVQEIQRHRIAREMAERARDESANTIAALHKAADEQGRELDRIAKGWYQLRAGMVSLDADWTAKAAEAITAPERFIWLSALGDLRALLASPTSSATTTEANGGGE